eukprot:gene3668-3929_t
MGHHTACHGITRGLTLAAANKPAAVLNQRLSFYRLLFSKPPAAKAHMLTALLSRRPQVAGQLTGADLEQLFHASTSADAMLTVLAGLAALPEDWEQAVRDIAVLGEASSASGSTTAGRGRRRSKNSRWVSSFVTAVLKLLSILASMPAELLAGRITEHVEAYSCMARQQYKRQQIQDLLLQLHTTHPHIMCYMDEGIYSRIAGLGPDKQLVAAKCLLETEFRPNWDRHVRDGSKYLMGVITKALREAGW